MQNSVWSLQRLFLQQGLIHLAYKIINYIDIQTLLQVINLQELQSSHLKGSKTEIAAKGNQSQSKIKRVIQIHCFLKEFLNKTDRSMYFSFYDEPEFQFISKQLQENIVIRESRIQTPSTKFSSQFHQLNQIFKQAQKQQLLSEEEMEELKRILADPSLPLPPLKRENEGIYCNSSFQLFLVGLRFPHYNQQSFTPFEELKQKIEEQEDLNFKQFLEIEKQKHSEMKVYENIHLVRYLPYEITYGNFVNLFLKNNSMHNFIVTIFALTDVWIEAVLSLVNLIDDPFYKFIELISRYMVFRSFVMELQDSLGFIFQSYENLYADTIRDSLFQQANMKPKYCFWRSALAKWFLKMNSIHTQTNQVYFMLLTKLRQSALMQKIDFQNQVLAWKPVKKHIITLKNSFELNPFSTEMKERIYQMMTGSSIIEQFISENQQTCEALIFQYVEYFIDLSINEQTVHWCGHSKHRLEKPFNLFNNEFTLYNQKFLAHLKNNVIAQTPQKDAKENIFQLFIQADLEFMESKNIKAVMLRQFVDDVNSKGKFFQDLIEDQTQQKIILMDEITNKQNLMNSQKQNKCEILFFNFTERDERLKYFNEKAKICESIEGQEKSFFSILPLLSPEEILTKSINTNDTSSNQDEHINSSYEYISEEECEEERENKNLQEKNLFKVQKKNSAKKKVKFQKDEECMENLEQISNEKKTLHSTNSSSKDSQLLNSPSQNQKSLMEKELLISKSQSI